MFVLYVCSRKNLDFSRTGLAKNCQKVRKGLPKLRWGSNKSTAFYNQSATVVTRGSTGLRNL